MDAAAAPEDGSARGVTREGGERGEEGRGGGGERKAGAGEERGGEGRERTERKAGMM